MFRSLIFCLASTSALADVYKCEVDGKITFSERPCAENAQKIQVEDTDQGLQVDEDFVRHQDAVTSRVLHNQNIDLEIELIRRSSARRVAEYRKKRDNCDATTYRGPNSATGALREQRVKDCVSEFEALIQQEQQRRDNEIRELRREKRDP